MHDILLLLLLLPSSSSFAPPPPPLSSPLNPSVHGRRNFAGEVFRKAVSPRAATFVRLYAEVGEGSEQPATEAPDSSPPSSAPSSVITSPLPPVFADYYTPLPPLKPPPSLDLLLAKAFALLSLLALFSTAVFHRIEKIPFVDALYFTLTTISTVGCGSVLQPSTSATRLLTAFLSCSGVAAIGGFAGRVLSSSLSLSLPSPSRLRRGFLSLSLSGPFRLVLLLASGAAGTYYLERPRLTPLDALYSAISIATTLGLGDVVPHTPGGKAFTSLFSLVGSLSFGAIVGKLAAIPLEKRERLARERVLERIPDTITEGLLVELFEGERVTELDLSESDE